VPVLVLFFVAGGRFVVGKAVGQPAHPITFIGMIAGAVGATAVVVVGTRAYGEDASPTTRFFVGEARGFSDDADRDTATWVVLFAGTLAGGAYPTVFHGILGLPGRYITHLFPTFATAALWGFALFCFAALLYLATGVLSVDTDSRGELVPFTTLAGLYTATFGVIVGLSRTLWFPFFGI
jgi:hypothetical protein